MDREFVRRSCGPSGKAVALEADTAGFLSVHVWKTSPDELRSDSNIESLFMEATDAT
jgi:hypothetical protein